MTHPVSSGVPTLRALKTIRNVIEVRKAPVTITRPTKSTGTLDQTTETTATHTDDIWLFDPRKSVQETVGGERLQGDLGGLALDGVDIQHGDRITHGGVEYEVDSVIGRPEDGDADGIDHDEIEYFVIDFIRRAP